MWRASGQTTEVMEAKGPHVTEARQRVEVRWKDLVAMSRWEKCMEAFLPLPWLVAGLWCYGAGWWLPGLVTSFYFFLTGLRQSHGAQHYALGLRRWVQDGILFALSVLMGASMHAVQVSHLHHHRHCLEPDDHEGSTARLSWWQAILLGPLFYIGLHRAAWEKGSRVKRIWIATEVIAIVSTFAAVVCWPSVWNWHFAAMLVGECFTGFFAVWTVHHHCAGHGYQARTQRGRWLNVVSYNMFLHAEHHLYPAVPTCHLPILAARLDAEEPRFANRRVLPLGRSESVQESFEPSIHFVVAGEQAACDAGDPP